MVRSGLADIRTRGLHRAVTLAAGVAAGCAFSFIQPAMARPAARAARTVTVRDEGYLRFASSSGSRLIDEGKATGTMPGWVRVRFTYNGEPTVYAQFTISTKVGT